jgi:predicted RNA-binding Zn ribbon-like protein
MSTIMGVRGPGNARAATDVVPLARADACLAFANTRFWRGRQEPSERLRGFADLVAWAAETVWPSADGLAALRQRGERRPREAERILRDAIALREAIYRAFAALAGGGAPGEHDLGLLNRLLEAAPPRRQLARGAGGLGWAIGRPAPTMTSLLAPVLWSAGDLLVARARVRQCANAECLWLFLDESKSGTRRWCDMAACGNRAKARRHYLKSRAQPAC